MNVSSTLWKGAASDWWFMKLMIQATPLSWKDVKAAMRTEFLPFDHVRRKRDKVCNFVQHSSVSKYLNEFQNLDLTIPDINDG